MSNETIGINGAAIGNIFCNFIVCIIGYVYLKKTIELKIDKKNCILKPIFATLIMASSAIVIKIFLKRIILEKLAIIVSISLATSTYAVLIMALKVLKKY